MTAEEEKSKTLARLGIPPGHSINTNVFTTMGASTRASSYGLTPYGYPNTPTATPFTAKPEHKDTPLPGWRLYSLTPDGYLKGSRQKWKEKKLVAECQSSHDLFETATLVSLLSSYLDKEQVDQLRAWVNGSNSAASNCISHLGAGSCSCGIWGRAEVINTQSDAFILASCLAYGTVATDEAGNWRASEVQIEQLYVVRQKYTNYLNNYIDWERLGYDLYSRYGVPTKVIDSVEEIGN